MYVCAGPRQRADTTTVLEMRASCAVPCMLHTHIPPHVHRACFGRREGDFVCLCRHGNNLRDGASTSAEGAKEGSPNNTPPAYNSHPQPYISQHCLFLGASAPTSVFFMKRQSRSQLCDFNNTWVSCRRGHGEARPSRTPLERSRAIISLHDLAVAQNCLKFLFSL